MLLGFALVGIRPVGHILLSQGGERPYAPKDYVGRVIDDAGKPVRGAGVTLILEGIPLETSTDSSGVYRITLTTRAEPISGTIAVYHRSYISYRGSIAIEPDSTVFPDVQLTRILATGRPDFGP